MAVRMRSMSAISAGLRESESQRFFSRPIPCSADTPAKGGQRLVDRTLDRLDGSVIFRTRRREKVEVAVTEMAEGEQSGIVRDRLNALPDLAHVRFHGGDSTSKI